jgi:hypothetical protein
MSFWSALVAIVAILAMTAARIARYQHGGDDRRRDMPQTLTSARESELQREVDDLRQRIAVLERIATEANSLDGRQSKAIAAEIESLRDR